MLAKLLKATIDFVYSCPSVPLSARLSAWNSAATEMIFIKFYIWVLLENLSRTFKFQYSLTRITGTLHEDRGPGVATSRKDPASIPSGDA